MLGKSDQAEQKLLFYDICVKIKGRLTLSQRSALPFQEYKAVAAAVSNEKQVSAWSEPFIQLHNEGWPPGGASYTQDT